MGPLVLGPDPDTASTRLTAQSATRLISSNFPHNRFLSSERAAALLTDPYRALDVDVELLA